MKTLGGGLGFAGMGGVAGAAEDVDQGPTSLLPVDEADFAEPTIEKSSIGPDTYVATPIRETRVRDNGYAVINLRGRVGWGKGELSMGGTAWLDSIWEAPSTGEYKLEAEYEHGGRNSDQIYNSAGITITREPSIAVENVRTGEIVGWDPKIGSSLVSAEITEQTIEFLLTRITSYLIFPSAGFIARRLANHILGEVFDHLIEVRPQGTTGRWLDSGATSFWAEEGEKYRIRFAVDNNLSGQCQNDDSAFVGHSAVYYQLNQFQISPVNSN
ncbi:hypothetical protein [Halorubrum salsamenti]|uniref:hypothetical protein n=1 Tax=Halorubrum salsamenti TaxID=2583990 RepID=UPI00119F7070|nr:hypothetical protein [Halorubrum salsamenti]